MKAMVYTGPLRLEVLDVEEPRPNPGEVLVRVRAAGICGSEVEGVVNRSPFRRPPLVMGHELMGTRADDGRRVVVNPILACRDCDLCLRGQPNLCRRRALIGVHRPGGFAEAVVVPERNLYPAPDRLSEAAGALVEPLANAVHALRLPADPTPRRLGVIGAGAIGLSVLWAALMLGVPEVEVADLVPMRLEIAGRLGAKQTGPALAGEFDVVVDAVGATVTRRGSVDLLRPGGTAVWLGMRGDEVDFSGFDLIRGGKSVLGSYAYTEAEFALALDLACELDTGWVTRAPLAEGPRLFGELMDGRTDLAKVQLAP